MSSLRAIACLAFLLGVSGRPGTKGRLPPLGWNTWCTGNRCGNDWCTSSEVLDVAQHIKNVGLLEMGYDHINLDDCWGVRNSTSNRIQGDPERFPEGMPRFIQKVHDLGFKFGLYTDIGEKACHSPFVGSWPYYQQDADTFAEWQVDYVKFDGCYLPSEKDEATLTCNMSEAMNKTGREMWLNFHCWHDKRCAECGNSFRIGPDHADSWESTKGIIQLLQKRQEFWGPDPDYGWPDPDFVFTGGQGCGGDAGRAGQRCPGQSDTEYITEFSIWAIASGQIVFASDPRNMSDIQRKILFNKEILDVYRDTSGFRSVRVIGNRKSGIVSRTEGFSQGCSVALVKQLSETKCILGQSYGCMENLKDMWTANGCRGTFKCNGIDDVVCNEMERQNVTCPCVPGPPSTTVWARPLLDGAAAVALFNGGDNATSITVKFKHIPDRKWDDDTQLSVRDLWKHADIGMHTGSFTANAVSAHGTFFIKLAPATSIVV